jgi:hypothetical protein
MELIGYEFFGEKYDLILNKDMILRFSYNT